MLETEKIYAPNPLNTKFFVDGVKRQGLLRKYKQITLGTRVRFDTIIYSHGLLEMEKELLNNSKP